jgi:hypothetical protein
MHSANITTSCMYVRTMLPNQLPPWHMVFHQLSSHCYDHQHEAGQFSSVHNLFTNSCFINMLPSTSLSIRKHIPTRHSTKCIFLFPFCTVNAWPIFPCSNHGYYNFSPFQPAWYNHLHNTRETVQHSQYSISNCLGVRFLAGTWIFYSPLHLGPT